MPIQTVGSLTDSSPVSSTSSLPVSCYHASMLRYVLRNPDYNCCLHLISLLVASLACTSCGNSATLPAATRVLPIDYVIEYESIM